MILHKEKVINYCLDPNNSRDLKHNLHPNLNFIWCKWLLSVVQMDITCLNKNKQTVETFGVRKKLSPRTHGPPSCLGLLLRTPPWRWWGSRRSGRTPAPPAGWRWESWFPGPQEHLTCRRGENQTYSLEMVLEADWIFIVTTEAEPFSSLTDNLK